MADTAPANLSQQFLVQSFTKLEAIRRFRVLKDFLNYRFFNLEPGIDRAAAFQKFVGEYSQTNSRANLEYDIAFVQSLSDQFIDQFTAKTAKTLLTQIEDGIKNAPAVILYVAFELPDPELKRIGQYFKTNFGPEILVDIQFNPALIGGCALSYKGIYRDFSIKQKIEQRQKELLSTLLSYRK